MKIFPAVHYTMGGLWANYERTAAGGLNLGAPVNLETNLAGLYAIGECNYHYHGANRLGANSLLSCIFDGLTVAPGLANRLASLDQTAAELPTTMFEAAVRRAQDIQQQYIDRPTDGANPYQLHLELGETMTRAATVVRRNDQLQEAVDKVDELADKVEHCALSDTGTWSNQNVVFLRALHDMFPLAKTILKGALQRNECRGAHYKPEFAMPPLAAEEPEARRAEAEAWCDRFEENNRQWLKSTIATWDGNQVNLTYEDVDTSLIAPRPRLYGLVGAEVIEEVWKQRQAARETTAAS